MSVGDKLEVTVGVGFLVGVTVAETFNVGEAVAGVMVSLGVTVGEGVVVAALCALGVGETVPVLSFLPDKYKKDTAPKQTTKIIITTQSTVFEFLFSGL